MGSIFVSSSPQWWRLEKETRRRRTVGVDVLDDPLCGHEKFIWAPLAPSVTASRATSLPEGGLENEARQRRMKRSLARP